MFVSSRCGCCVYLALVVVFVVLRISVIVRSTCRDCREREASGSSVQGLSAVLALIPKQMNQSSYPSRRSGPSQLPVSSNVSKEAKSARSKMAKTSVARDFLLSNPKTTRHNSRSGMPTPRRHRRFATSFCSTLRRSPPAIPPSLRRFVLNIDQDKNWAGSQAAKKKDNIGLGRVKALLRICPESVLARESAGDAAQQSPNKGSILRVEGNQKHVTIFDSETGLRSAQMRVGVSAPKLYAFDAVFSEDASQAEICSTSLVDVIQAVIQGADGAVFCYGHSGLGKTYTLIGSDVNGQDLGIIPCAISWLFRAIDEVKDKTKGRFSVRVSAVEVHGRTEELKDLLRDQAKDDAPGEDLCVREDPLFGTQLQNQCELRASSVEKAAYFLDAALASRSSSGARSTEEARRHSHMVYTLHVYQYTLDKFVKAGVTGGRSRLHFIDLGSCERTLVKTPNSLTLSLNSLGHVIMAIINNSKHVPFKESKLTLVLQDLLGNFNCRTVMLAHVAKGYKHYTETLSTVQIASRIHRVCLKKKTKVSPATVNKVGCHNPKSIKSHRTRGTDDESLGTSSGVGETSGSEISCDTVIYVRPNGVPFSDRELTDNEGPPPSVPIQTPLQSQNGLSKINENERRFTGGPIGHAHTRAEKAPSEEPKGRRDQLSKLPVPKISQRSSNITPSTQSRLAIHAKLVGSIRDGEHRASRLPRSNGSKHNILHNNETTGADKRKNTKIPNCSREKANHENQQSSIKRGAKTKIPPPPPPRLPTTRLQHTPSKSVRGEERWKQTACANSRPFHQPTYETLHASHKPASKKQSNNHHIVQPIAPEEETFLEKHRDGEATVGCVEENLGEVHYPPTEAAYHVANRADAKGNNSDEVNQRLTGPGRTTRANMSYSTVTIDPLSTTKSDISRCIHDFNDVLNTVEENGSLDDAISIASRQEARPASMVVNLNDCEWNSGEDDTLTSDNDVSEGEDVVGVNFYCLSFTTKNPLIPLSKSSFARQVSKRKRLSLERRSSDGSIASDTPRTNTSEEKWADKVGHPFETSEEHQVEIESETSAGSLKRSNTFDIDSDLPMSLLQDGSCSQKIDDSEVFVDGGGQSPEGSSISIGGTSTKSSPSQVLLYDSSSLEINYVKPKSFQEYHIHRPNSAKEPKKLEGSLEILNPNMVPSSLHPRKDVPNDQKKGRKILVTGSNNGTQLSLVRSEGSASTLELVITAQDGEDRSEHTFSRQKTLPGHAEKSISSQQIKYADHSEKDKASPNKRSKWGGIMRFGSKKSKAKQLSQRSRSESPALDKTTRKAENHALEKVKLTASSNQSFVSKLLSPKSRRSHKLSSSPSTSTDFRYTSPSVISQMRPNIVTTANSLVFANHGEDTSVKTKRNANENNSVYREHRNARACQHRVSPQPSPSRNRFGFARKAKTFNF